MADVRIGLIASTQTRGAVSAMQRYGKAVEDAFEKKSKKATREVKALQKSTDKFGRSVKKVLSRQFGIAALGSALASISVGGLARFVVSTNAAIDAEVKFARLLGVGVQQLREYGFAADRIAGTGVDEFRAGIQRAQRLLGEFATTGGGQGAAVFEQLGTSIRHADGRVKNILDLFPDLNRLVRESADETERLLVISQLFGAQRTSFGNLLGADPKQIEAATDRLRDLRGVLDDTEGAESMADSVSELGEAWNGFKESLAETFGPDVQRGLDKLTGFLVKARDPQTAEALKRIIIPPSFQRLFPPAAAFPGAGGRAFDTLSRGGEERQARALAGPAPFVPPETVREAIQRRTGVPSFLADSHAEFLRSTRAGAGVSLVPPDLDIDRGPLREPPSDIALAAKAEADRKAADAATRLEHAALAAAAGLGAFLSKLFSGDAGIGDFLGFAGGIAGIAIGGTAGAIVGGLASGLRVPAGGLNTPVAARRGAGGLTLVVTYGAESMVEATVGNRRAVRRLDRGLRDEAVRFGQTGRVA
jgi:hypothetical protein